MNTESKKKKLSEMSASEFLEYGLDSDLSCDENEDEEEKQDMLHNENEKKIKGENRSSRNSESSAHKAQLDRLKEKDPEFYRFLQENDEELLGFSDSDDEEVESDDDADSIIDEEDKPCDEEPDSMQKIKNVTNNNYNDDSEGDQSENSKEETKNEGKIVTTGMIKQWKKGLEKDSIKTLKAVLHAFHTCVETMSPEETDDKAIKKMKKTKYVIKGGMMFNSLVAMCLKYSVKILEKYLDYVNKKRIKKVQLPSSSKQWSLVKASVKQYLLDVLQLLRQLTDPSILTVILRHCQSLCPYYACFPKITKMLLKRLIRMWSSGEDHVRVLAFLCIRKLSLLIPTLFEYMLKKLYLGYVRNSKFVNLKTKPTLTFMRNSLLEMFALDESITYRHAFVYIRQLAIHLRNAITTEKKDAHQSVYNWQYISCLQLWTLVIGEIYGEVLKPLVYPIVQITLGVIRLIPAARYYPIRFQSIDSLNYLSRKTGVYIPTASFILEAVESKEFQKKPKSSEKTPEFTTVLKLSKTQLMTKGFQDRTIDLAFEALLDHYVIFSNSIAFPELIFPVCHRLKHLIKASKVFKLCKDMKSLVDKIQSHAEEIHKTRGQVTFSPKDVKLVKLWESEQTEKKNLLSEFCESWKRMKDFTAKAEHIDQAISCKKSTKIRKRKFNRSDESTDKKMRKAKKKKSKADKKEGSREEDIVEDFAFSDDED